MQNHCVIIENNDLIQILEGYVIKAYLKKKSKEIEDARNFHEENYININTIDINKDKHYLMYIIFNTYIRPPRYDYWRVSEWELKKNKLVKMRINIYESELYNYLELREIDNEIDIYEY